ncbi:Cytosolic sulfotransferase 15 [Bienertia sinuspersici]
MVKYQNFWCRTIQLKGLKPIIYYQKHFKAKDTDIIIASQPKTGATWLKSLLFTIVNRLNPDHLPLNEKSPLLEHNPHELVYFLEHGVYAGNSRLPSPQQLDELASPRLLHTHLPYASLPESIRTSPCKILCIARNPFDTFVSNWHWQAKLIKNLDEDDEFQPPRMEDFLEDFCNGKFPFGPYFDHVVEFWKLSIQQPNKILFLKYEDLKGDEGIIHFKKLAEFVGFPFSAQEESEGSIDDIIELCNFNNLKNLEVNKTGFMNKMVEMKNFFRKREVGDWTNYFTPTMVERFNILIKEKFQGTGLCFQVE